MRIEKKINLITLLFCVLLFLLPVVLSGNRYYLGGDDGGLYYLYPKQFIQNFASNIVTDNAIAGASMGYNSLLYYIPFVSFIYLLKLIPNINVQGVMYGINLSLGFLFFYKFIDLFLDHDRRSNYLIKLISGLIYVLSPFLLGTLYLHQYTAMYLVSILPMVIYFFYRSVFEEKLYFSLISVLVFSIFSSVLITFPWWLAFCVALIPLVLLMAMRKVKILLKYIIVSIISFVLLNFYWLIHFVYPVFIKESGPGALGFYSSESINSENIRISDGVSRLYNSFNVIFETMQSMDPSKWGLTTYLNLVVFIVIVTAGLFVVRIRDKDLKIKYFISLLGLLLTWYLFSPNIGDWGPELFVYLVKTIPLFGSFRNMYDKFALPLSFYFALTLGVSLIIVKNKQWLYKSALVLIAIMITLWTANYINMYSSSNIDSRRVSGKFSKDYLELMNVLESNTNESRMMWLPLNSPTYTYIQDDINPNSYYSGVSPTRILANKTDLTGRFSFISPNDLFLGDKIVFQMLRDKEFEKVMHILQSLNVRYLIVDNRIYPEDVSDYYFDIDRKILNNQSADFYNSIVGKKISDINNSFSLYEINGNYLSDKVEIINNDISDFESTLNYEKINSSEYIINLNSLNSNTKLIFREAFDQQWDIYGGNNYAISIDDIGYSNYQEGHFGNVWEIDPILIKRYLPKDTYIEKDDGSINVKLKIFFKPQMIVPPSISVSIVSLIFIILYICYSIYKQSQYRTNR